VHITVRPQVYADEAFNQGKRILRRKDITEQEKDALILEAYKQVYRAVWNSPIVAKVRFVSNALTV